MDIFTRRTLLAVIAAGVVGTLANTVALVPGRYAVAIALCLALPLLTRKVGDVWFFVIGILWLTVAASVLANLVFGVGAPWAMVLGFNLVHAIAAIATYRVIAFGAANYGAKGGEG